MATVHSLPHTPRAAANAKATASSHPLQRLGTPAKAALIAVATTSKPWGCRAPWPPSFSPA